MNSLKPIIVGYIIMASITNSYTRYILYNLLATLLDFPLDRRRRGRYDADEG